MKSIKKAVAGSTAKTRRYIKTYRVGVIGAAIVFLIWSIGGVYGWKYLESQQSARAASSERLLSELDKTIERLEEEKAEKKRQEEQKAKEAAAAEAKKKAEEEAEKTARANQGTSGSTATGCNQATSHTNPNSVDVMVNKKHCLVPISFAPSDLVTTHGATISAKAAGDFNRMFADAATAGQPFSVTSSYRSYTTQVSTYNYWVSVNGQEAADTVSARPGFSEHQTGLAVDVGANGCNLDCFGGTSQYQWFLANAAKYGFVQRYYSGYEGVTGYAGEEWHFRYVGVPTALDMKAKDIKTLEQYWNMEGGNYR